MLEPARLRDQSVSARQERPSVEYAGQRIRRCQSRQPVFELSRFDSKTAEDLKPDDHDQTSDAPGPGRGEDGQGGMDDDVVKDIEQPGGRGNSKADCTQRQHYRA